MFVSTFYKPNIIKLTNAELRRITPNWVVYGVARLHKLLNWPFRPIIGFRRSDALDFLEFDEMSRSARRALRDTIDECEDLGFRLEFCHALENIGAAEAYSVVLLSPDAQIWAALLFTRVRIQAGEKTKRCCALVSLRADDSAVSTTNLTREFDSPPWVNVQHVRGAGVGKLLATHRERLRAESPRSLSSKELIAAVLSLHQRGADWNIARGVWMPMTPEEEQRVRARSLGDED